MFRLWDYILYLLPILLGLLLIPGEFNDWWKTHVAPFLLGGICLVAFILTLNYLKLVVRKLYQEKTRGPDADHLNSIKENVILNIHSSLLITEGVDHARMKQFNWLELDRVLSGPYHISFKISQEEGEPVLESVSLSDKNRRLCREDISNLNGEKLVVDSGEILILVDCSMHSMRLGGSNLEAEIEKVRREIKHGIGIIPGPEKTVAGLMVLPPFGDGEYRVAFYKQRNDIYHVSIKCVPAED